jgi:membrane-bound lytic murein transglycosylase D
VRKGETIASIARKYDVSDAVIISYNKLSSKKKLVQGAKLKIPITREKNYAVGNGSRQKNDSRKIASSGRYKVKKGETLSMIARRFSVSPAQIKKLNKLKADKICIGQTLKLPQNEAETDAEDQTDKDVKKPAKKSKIHKSVLSTNDLDKLGTNKYIVTKNDSLHSIATKNNMNVARLLELNKISIDEKLVPGQILIIK